MGRTEWLPIPGYEGVYWMTRAGDIRNARGHILTAIEDEALGLRVDLRNNGQRSRVFVEDLIVKTFGGMSK